MTEAPTLTLCKSPELLGKYSAQISKYLHRLEDRTDGFYTAEKVSRRFVDGNWHCWIIKKGERVVAVGGSYFWEDDSGNRIFTPEFVEGDDYDDWFPFADFVYEWSKKVGCSMAYCKARKSHARRALAGWKVTHSIFERRT